MNDKVGIEDRVKLIMYGYEAVSRTVTKSGNSGMVYLPKRLIGKKVTVVFVEA